MYAIAAIDALAESGVRFAVIHNELGVAHGQVVSDVDLAVFDHPREVLRRAIPHFRKAGLQAIVYWPYDVPDTGTVFLCTSDATEGVQLDLLCDPHGLGEDGIRSDALLEHRVSGIRWDTARREHEMLYLIRKRDRKHDDDALRNLLLEASQLAPSDVRSAAETIFRPDIAERVATLIKEGRRPSITSRHPPGHWRRELQRMASRLREPSGFWVDIDNPEGEKSAARLATRFGRFLPYASSGRRLSAYAFALWMHDVMPVRLRAGIFASWGPGDCTPKPDLVVNQSADDVDPIASQVVAALAERVITRIDHA